MVVPFVYASTDISLELTRDTAELGKSVQIQGLLENYDRNEEGIVNVDIFNESNMIIDNNELIVFTDGTFAKNIILDSQKFSAPQTYTVIATYQEMEARATFDVTVSPPTTEELSVIIQTQESSFNEELKKLQDENAELRQQISDLNDRIDNLLAVVQEQINVMMAYFQ